MSKYLIAGNWKMNTSLEESHNLVKSLLDNSFDSSVEMLICPPFTHLSSIAQIIKSSEIKLGAQNSYFEEKGAYTGEISNSMLKNVGCNYVILGHSERRTIFAETNEIINKKVLSSLNSGLKVILCIGETLEQQKNGETHQVLETQLKDGLSNITFEEGNLTIAYEPVWAIGTGIVPTEEQIAENHKFICDWLETNYLNQHIKILYGGSLNAKNSDTILSIKNVDGGLIGGAALDSDSFIQIYQSAINLI